MTFKKQWVLSTSPRYKITYTTFNTQHQNPQLWQMRNKKSRRSSNTTSKKPWLPTYRKTIGFQYIPRRHSIWIRNRHRGNQVRLSPYQSADDHNVWIPTKKSKRIISQTCNKPVHQHNWAQVQKDDRRQGYEVNWGYHCRWKNLITQHSTYQIQVWFLEPQKADSHKTAS